MTDFERLGIVLARVVGLVVLLAGIGSLLAGIVTTAGDFNPVYAGFYFMTVLAGPLVWVLLGVGVLCFARRIGRCIARGLGG